MWTPRFRTLAEHASMPRLDMICGYRKVRRDTWLMHRPLIRDFEEKD